MSYMVLPCSQAQAEEKADAKQPHSTPKPKNKE